MSLPWRTFNEAEPSFHDYIVCDCGKHYTAGYFQAIEKSTQGEYVHFVSAVHDVDLRDRSKVRWFKVEKNARTQDL